MTPITEPGEDGVTTEVNKTLTLNSDIPTITNRSIISEVMNKIRNSNFSTKRTLRQIENNLIKTVVVAQPTDWLYKTNNWYKWVEYTGKQIKAEDCYMCAKSRIDALYVTNTKHRWGICEEEMRNYQKQEGNPAPAITMNLFRVRVIIPGLHLRAQPNV